MGIKDFVNKILKRVSEDTKPIPKLRKKSIKDDGVGWVNFNKSHLLYKRRRLEKHELVIYRSYYDSSGILFRGKRKLK